MARRITGWLAAMALLALPVAAALPVAPSQAQAAISASDKRAGLQAYGQIVQEFGGKVEGPLADYVRQVGLRVALPSIPGSTPADWTITLLDSPVPNAMATPGGYLYITRGLMGMINSEAELASVLGHEAGHVAGRHSAKRQGRATLGALATIGAALLGGDLAAQAAQLGSAAFVQGYSRSQEHDADSRGLRYSAAAGYDPRAAASMLEALERVSAVEGRQQMERAGLQSIFASHPVTRERVERVAREAAKLPSGGEVDREPYLKAIDGMVFGDSPAQGIVSGPSFRHAGLRLGFDAPPGFMLQNRPDAVLGQGRDGSQFRFAMARIEPGQPLEPVVRQTWQQLTNGRIPRVSYRETRVNQLDAALSEGAVNTSRGAVNVGVHAFRFDDRNAAIFLTQAPMNAGDRFQPLVSSFRRLTPAEIAAAERGRRIRVITVKPGDSVDTLARRMAAPYDRAESFRALNGIGNRPLKPGETVKIIAG